MFLHAVTEYEDAAREFDRTIRLDQQYAALGYAFKGESLRKLGKEHLQEAVQSLQSALAQDQENISCNLSFSEVLRAIGEIDAANAKCQWIIDQVWDGSTVDPNYLSALGWCRYRLNQYDEAARLFVEALSLNLEDVLVNQFNLALTFLRDDKHDLAISEYWLGLRMVESKESALRRRAPLREAAHDLEEAIGEDQELMEVEGLENIRDELDRASFEAVVLGAKELEPLKEHLRKLR
jgi:tetratricopeptide (TPR) repeat protein